MNKFSVASQIVRNDEFAKHGHDIVKKIMTAQAQNAEASITAQLNEFISRGLIVVEINESVLVQNAEHMGIEVRQAVKLKLKDQEYIEKLETENKLMKEKLEAIQKAFV